ncbi:AarF/UbiB family protein [Deferribacter thermophilus]|uniref:ABC1 kinase family protein n=1 Tax=Deferribacter thermophilus TaxID=53573 RepID=UPI003C2A4F87
MFFTKQFRNINRLREILFIIAGHGFGKFLDDIYLSSLISFGKKIVTFGRYKRSAKLPVEVRFRLMLEELGPTFIKLGQMLSTRDDILPEYFIKELTKLHDSVKAEPFKKVEKRLKAKYGDLNKYFIKIDVEPLAAASIAQVYHAVTTDGKDVVLKIKRGNIKEIIDTDFAIILWLAGLAEQYIPEAKELKVTEYLSEFYSQIQRELDFEIEIAYMKKFKEFFAYFPGVIIPEVVEELCNEDIIVMSYHEGISIDEVSTLKSLGYDTKKLATLGVEFYLKQVFELNLFHGDPHPGNFLVDKNGNLVLLDFGIIGKIDDKLLVHLSRVFSYLIDFNVNKLVDELVSFGIIDDESDLRAIKSDLMDALLPVYGKDLNRINFKKSFERIFKVARKYRFYFPKDYFLIMKTFMFLEATGKKLYPEFNMLQFAKKYAYKYVKDSYNFESFKEELLKFTESYINIFKNIPEDYARVKKQVYKIEKNVEHLIESFDEYIKHHDKAFNRLGFSILISSTVLSSTIMLIEGFGPKLYGVSIFGALGICFSFIMGVLLTYGYFKSGRL